jgi:hypothetical protein
VLSGDAAYLSRRGRFWRLGVASVGVIAITRLVALIGGVGVAGVVRSATGKASPYQCHPEGIIA